jgi:hypothetical protein
LTSIKADKLRAAGRIFVSGTIEAIKVEILSRPQLAEQLGVSEEQLDNMRADMLAVDEQR